MSVVYLRIGAKRARQPVRAGVETLARNRLQVIERRQRAAEQMEFLVMPVSWPTAEMSGIMLAAAARTTISSLNDHRSSSEPPPRATMIKSGRGSGPPSGIALKP